jgi:hypothetical protein
MKLSQLAASTRVFQELCSQKVSRRVAYRLAIVSKLIAPYVEELTRHQAELGNKYGVPVDGGFKIPEEKIKSFMEELAPILDEDVPVNIPKISVDDLPELMAADDIILLDWLIEGNPNET